MNSVIRKKMRSRFGKSPSFWKLWTMLEKESEEREKAFAEWETKWQKAAEERQKESAEREAQRQKEAAEREAQRQKEAAEREKKETEQRQKDAEWEAQRKKAAEEYEKQHKETERVMKELGQQMGGLHRRFGEMAEYMVAPGVVDLFNDLGFHITQAATHGMRILNEKKQIRTEIDLFMGNGDYIIAVEVKTSLGEKDIEKHLRRLEILREDTNKTGDRRKILGGMAVAVLDENDRKAILDAGFYLLEPSGDMMKMDLPEGFVPREW